MNAEPSFGVTRPQLTHISVFEIGQAEEADKSLKILQRISNNYPSEATVIDGNTITISLGGKTCSLRAKEEASCRVFGLTCGSSDDNYVSKNWPADVSDYLQLTGAILQLLPESPISEFGIFVGATDSERDALSLLQQYSSYLGCREAGRGMTRGCLMATFERGVPKDSDCLRKEFLVSPFAQAPLEAKPTVSKFGEEFAHLALYAGKLSRLVRSDELFFRNIAAEELDTQQRLEDIFTQIANFDQMQVDRLKLWLGELFTRFSSLVVLTSSMRRDYSIARTYASEIGTLLDQWDERISEEYPTNSSAAVREYETLLKPFGNFLERADALRIQLETILDSIRTYLSIQQQEQNAAMLKAIERHENLLKALTWVIALLTITMVVLQVINI